jgi:hypothetical protein
MQQEMQDPDKPGLPFEKALAGKDSNSSKNSL